MTIQPSSAKTPEEFLDVLAYTLATNPATSNVQWILGDVGMGKPTQLPFGYISLFNEDVLWMTANGGTGGLASGGATGQDDWRMQVSITIAFQGHQYIEPVQAVPPAGSPVSAAALGGPPPFMEQPQWRLSLQLAEAMKAVLRTNITVSGEIATSRITESRYLLQVIGGNEFRAFRLTVQAQQRRPRGN